MAQGTHTPTRKNKLLVIVDPQIGEVRSAYDDEILIKIGEAIKTLTESRDDFYICVVGIYDGSFSKPFIAHSLSQLNETLVARGTLTGHQLHPAVADAHDHVDLYAGKMTADAFSNSVMNAWILSNSIDEMYFCGLQCNSCVFFSATSDLIDKNIPRYLVQDLTNAEPPYTSGAKLKRDMDKFIVKGVHLIRLEALLSAPSDPLSHTPSQKVHGGVPKPS